MEESGSSIVLQSVHLNISLQEASLSVLCVPNEFVPKCAWALMREYGMKTQLNSKSFHAVLSDDDGLSIICSSQLIPTFQFLLSPSQYTLSSNNWRALVINLNGSAYELPGMVHCLANSLSQEGLSILHISTFEAEVFLVQDPDVTTALSILRQFEDAEQVLQLMEKTWKPASSYQKPQLMIPPAAVTVTTQMSDTDEAFSIVSDGNEFDESWLTPQVSTPEISAATMLNLSSPIPVSVRFASGFTLCVLPNPVILAKLRDDASWAACAPILVSVLHIVIRKMSMILIT